MFLRKKCPSCSTIKSINQFNKDSKGFLNKANTCKECVNKRRRDRHRQNKEKRNSVNRKWYWENREVHQRKNKRWMQENACIQASRVAKRHAKKIQQTPKWANENLIQDWYRMSDLLSKQTGVKYHVDHIVPLQGNTVSGLHVEYNLQLLKSKENIRKSNK